MTLSSRIRTSLLVVMAAAAVVAALVALPAPSAQAFFVQNHETITRNALPPGQVSEPAMLQILVGPPPGAGNVGSDAFFSDDFRHIDNARDPVEICARALQAWNTFEPVILSGSRQVGGDLANGPAARAAFGGLAHSLQDFYSHTNWVETNVADGQLNRLSPPLFPKCDPATLPAGLHSGFFDVTANHEDPLSGCPPEGPPPGFVECHSTLNKDGPNSLRGLQPVPGTNMNLYDLAAQLATTATTNLFNQIRGLVASANGERAAVLLFSRPAGPPALPAGQIPSLPAGLLGN